MRMGDIDNPFDGAFSLFVDGKPASIGLSSFINENKDKEPTDSFHVTFSIEREFTIPDEALRMLISKLPRYSDLFKEKVQKLRDMNVRPIKLIMDEEQLREVIHGMGFDEFNYYCIENYIESINYGYKRNENR